MARIYGMLGSVDANTGDAQTGIFFFQAYTDSFNHRCKLALGY
jgi:xylose isomerase